MRSNLQPIPTHVEASLGEEGLDLESLIKDKLHDLSPAKRRLLELFLAGDDLDVALLEAEEEHVSPRTATELELCEIWEEVLGLDSVGVRDNFFDLGGDSILSIRIVAKANRLGMPLTSRQLFENPTIAALGELVDSQPRRALEDGVEFPGALDCDSISVAHTVPASPAPAANCGVWTPEDFPEAELTPEDLEHILAQTSRTAQTVATPDLPEPLLAAGAPAGAAEAGALRVAGDLPRPLVFR